MPDSPGQARKPGGVPGQYTRPGGGQYDNVAGSGPSVDSLDSTAPDNHTGGGVKIFPADDAAIDSDAFGYVYRQVLCIDVENGTIEVFEHHRDAQVSNIRMYHGFEQWYDLGPRSGEQYDQLMREIAPHVKTMSEQFYSKWDGHNHVASFFRDSEPDEWGDYGYDDTVESAVADIQGLVDQFNEDYYSEEAYAEKVAAAMAERWELFQSDLEVNVDAWAQEHGAMFETVVDWCGRSDSAAPCVTITHGNIEVVRIDFDDPNDAVPTVVQIDAAVRQAIDDEWWYDEELSDWAGLPSRE